MMIDAEFLETLTVEVRESLGIPLSPVRFTEVFTKLSSLILDLRFLKNEKEASTLIERVTSYGQLRYEEDIPLGHQEANLMVKKKIAEREREIADLEAVIEHLQRLISLMTIYEKLVRY